MRRFPTPWLPLAAVVLTAGIAGAARADSAPLSESETADTDSEDTEDVAMSARPSTAQGEPAPAPVPAATAPAAAPAPAPVPVLAPAAPPPGMSPQAAAMGLVAGGGDRFPLTGGLSMSNSLGNGWLAPSSTGQMQPSWATSLSMRGAAALPKVDFLPRLMLSTGMSFSMANWLDNFTNGGVYQRQVRASDISLGLNAFSLYQEPFTKINLGASISGRVPTSITSRHRNVLTTLGLSLPLGWSSDEAAWGAFALNLSPSARLSLFTAPATTIPCEAGTTRAQIVEDPLEEGLLPVAYGREAQLLPDGSCVLPGRQNTVSLSTSFGVSWWLGNHSLSADIGYSAGFLQALPANPAVQSPFASNQDFNESTNGSVSYSYRVPVEGFNMNVSTGLSSSQAPWIITGLDETGATIYQPSFPFWDFYFPAQNSSSAFVDVSVGL
jgi:hypothetical protein